jgi:hypothetical protein
VKTIDEINMWLESQASQCKDNWGNYYRGLKDFHLLDKFTLSSADLITFYYQTPPTTHPIVQYIQDNNLKYNINGGTGFCDFVKI